MSSLIALGQQHPLMRSICASQAQQVADARAGRRTETGQSPISHCPTHYRKHPQTRHARVLSHPLYSPWAPHRTKRHPRVSHRTRPSRLSATRRSLTRRRFSPAHCPSRANARSPPEGRYGCVARTERSGPAAALTSQSWYLYYVGNCGLGKHYPLEQHVLIPRAQAPSTLPLAPGRTCSTSRAGTRPFPVAARHAVPETAASSRMAASGPVSVWYM